ncbi:hypothetical protein BPAE_0021g00310 [Botrytis paeoniae]|uniref:Uncharacterized protein n=1 Tax=Botrytis paeoniae TaxID=278948 RepID=A0A4Z1FZ29_9HELO|nr:hypothetical protein BPAE_0021g00310 [Botrytis paeoniae]
MLEFQRLRSIHQQFILGERKKGRKKDKKRQKAKQEDMTRGICTAWIRNKQKDENITQPETLNFRIKLASAQIHTIQIAELNLDDSDRAEAKILPPRFSAYTGVMG